MRKGREGSVRYAGVQQEALWCGEGKFHQNVGQRRCWHLASTGEAAFKRRPFKSHSANWWADGLLRSTLGVVRSGTGQWVWPLSARMAGDLPSESNSRADDFLAYAPRVADNQARVRGWIV